MSFNCGAEGRSKEDTSLAEGSNICPLDTRNHLLWTCFSAHVYILKRVAIMDIRVLGPVELIDSVHIKTYFLNILTTSTKEIVLIFFHAQAQTQVGVERVFYRWAK